MQVHCRKANRHLALRLQLVLLALCGGDAGVASQADGASLCHEMQQQMSPYLTDAEFVQAWQARTWEDPRVYSPVNRPAMAQRARWQPQVVPRTDAPRDLVSARLRLQQIHGIDEKRQYYEADGSLTFRCARSNPVSTNTAISHRSGILYRFTFGAWMQLDG